MIEEICLWQVPVLKGSTPASRISTLPQFQLCLNFNFASGRCFPPASRISTLPLAGVFHLPVEFQLLIRIYI